MKKICKLLALGLSTLFLMTAYASHNIRYNKLYPNVVASVQADPDLSTFALVIQKTGLTKRLERNGPYTIFAPTNNAFEDLPDGVLQHLMQPQNKQQLIAMLREHIVYGRKPTAKDATYTRQEVETGRFKTLNGHMITVTRRGHRFYINNSVKLKKRDILAKNGAVHIIHKVFLPTSMKRRMG